MKDYKGRLGKISWLLGGTTAVKIYNENKLPASGIETFFIRFEETYFFQFKLRVPLEITYELTYRDSGRDRCKRPSINDVNIF